MSELPGRRLITIEIPGTIDSPELNVALVGLREAVEANGGHMFDRTITREINLLNDNDLRRVAACIEPMRAVGLLDPDRQIKDLVIGTEHPQSLWDATDYGGLNRQVVNDLTRTVRHGETIKTVHALLCTVHYGMKNVSDKKLALLRQALIDSGMPEEFPWPWKYTLNDEDKLLRGLSLIAPTFAELPMVTKKEVASIFRVWQRYSQPEGRRELSDSQLELCAARYAERRKEVLRIVGWES